MRRTTAPPCDGVERIVRPRTGERRAGSSRRRGRRGDPPRTREGAPPPSRHPRRGRARGSRTHRRCRPAPGRRRCGALPRRARGSLRGSRAASCAARRGRSPRGRARRPDRRDRSTRASRTAVHLLEPGEQPRHGDRARPRCGTTCVPASPKSMTSSSISPRRRTGTPKKQSSVVVFPFGSWTSANPPPAGPVSGPSVTNAVKAAPRSASTAFPPSRNTRRTGLGRQRMAGSDRASHPETVLRSER